LINIGDIMNPLTQSILFGFAGGAVRGAIGVLKAVSLKKEISVRYWSINAVIAALIGGFAGLLFTSDYRITLLAGYCGTDILEGISKAAKKGKMWRLGG